jgi:hypothetical protein
MVTIPFEGCVSGRVIGKLRFLEYLVEILKEAKRLSSAVCEEIRAFGEGDMWRGCRGLNRKYYEVLLDEGASIPRHDL